MNFTLRILAVAAIAVALAAAATATLLSPRAQPEAAPAAKADVLAAHPIRVIPLTKADRLPAQALVPAAKEQARLPQEAPPEPAAAPLVAKNPPAPQAPPAPAVALAEPEEPVNHVSRETGRYRHGGDLCARTGGWRVTLRGGRSWRCAYGRR